MFKSTSASPAGAPVDAMPTGASHSRGPVRFSLVHPLPRTVAATNTEVNMALYAAIVGKVPEIDASAGHVLIPAPEARLQRPWSPIVLSIYLREAYRQSALHLNKPEIAAWIRRQSAVAKKRFQESQHRLTTARKGRAA